MTQYANVNGVRLPFPDDATKDEIDLAVRNFAKEHPVGNTLPDYTTKGKGGLADYLPDAVTKGLQTFNDVTTSAQDAGTRGFGGKITGTGGAVDKARERLGAWHYPGDIISSIAMSPYKVGSYGAAAGYGAMEGGLNAYGHQKNWVPQSKKDVLDIITGMGTGAATGTAGYGIGDKVASSVTSKMNKANQPFPTDDALEAAIQAGRAGDPVKAQASLDRVNELRAIQTASREATERGAPYPSEDVGMFNRYMENTGMHTPTPERQLGRQLMERADQPVSNLTASLAEKGAKAGPAAGAAVGAGIAKVAGTNIGTGATIGGMAGYGAGGTAGGVAGRIADAFLNRGRGRLPEQGLEELIAKARDPESIGMGPAPEVVNPARDFLSKLFMGYGARRNY